MLRSICLTVIGGIFIAGIASGCVQHELWDTDNVFHPKLCDNDCHCLHSKHTVFLVSSQGSQFGPGGSQFSDYILKKYKDRADFVYEPLLSLGIDPPTHERLETIAHDISEGILEHHDVWVWAFSLGADSMSVISELVYREVGSVDAMHVLLIDPMILDDPFGRWLVGIHADLGMPIGKFLRDAAPFIKSHPKEWINLSGGTVFNIDLSPNPLLLLTKCINVDRHYPWAGVSELQKKALVYLDMRFTASLEECSMCSVQ